MTVETGEFVTIEPEWAGLTRWWAYMLAEHGFEQFAYGPVASFMEAVRYLSVKDPDALEAIIKELEAKG